MVTALWEHREGGGDHPGGGAGGEGSPIRKTQYSLSTIPAMDKLPTDIVEKILMHTREAEDMMAIVSLTVCLNDEPGPRILFFVTRNMRGPVDHVVFTKPAHKSSRIFPDGIDTGPNPTGCRSYFLRTNESLRRAVSDELTNAGITHPLVFTYRQGVKEPSPSTHYMPKTTGDDPDEGDIERIFPVFDDIDDDDYEKPHEHFEKIMERIETYVSRM